MTMNENKELELKRERFNAALKEYHYRNKSIFTLIGRFAVASAEFRGCQFVETPKTVFGLMRLHDQALKRMNQEGYELYTQYGVCYPVTMRGVYRADLYNFVIRWLMDDKNRMGNLQKEAQENMPRFYAPEIVKRYAHITRQFEGKTDPYELMFAIEDYMKEEEFGLWTKEYKELYLPKNSEA